MEGLPTSGSTRGGVPEWVRSVLVTIALVLFIRQFFVEAYRIPSGSMVPSLLVGDWLFVNKLVYGPVVPFVDAHLPGYADPKRDEIAVFVSPNQIDQPADPTPTLVKRLVGTPGDTLFMRKGLLHVNGVPRPQGEGFQGASPYGGSEPNEANPLFVWQKRFALADSRFGPAPETPTHDDWGPLLIPPGYYMFLGDNRYFSKDSRYWGLVPRANLRGRPIVVYYSYDPDVERFLPFLTAIRWERLGHLIR
ncbi:MAG: signal peptidase I [Gemmatimonadaceae bacterium]